MKHILLAGIVSSVCESATAQFTIGASVQAFSNVPESVKDFETPYKGSLTLRNVGSSALQQPGNILSTSEASRLREANDHTVPYNYRFELENVATKTVNQEFTVRDEVVPTSGSPYLLPDGVPVKFFVYFHPKDPLQTGLEATRYQIYFRIYDTFCSLQYGNELTDERCVVHSLPIIMTPEYWLPERKNSNSNAPPEKRYPMIKNRPLNMDPPGSFPISKFPDCYSYQCDIE